MIQNLKQPQGNYVRNCWDRATHPHSQRRRCGGRRRDRRARLRHPWAAAGPGRTTSRRTQPHASDTAPPTWRAPEGARGPGCGARGRWRSLAGQRADAPSHTQATQHRRRGGRRRDQRAWLRCPWAAAGPGRGAGGWRQGQGGPRDRPLRAAGSRVAISRAGRRQPAHTAAGPHKATQEPLNGIAKGAGISRPLARVPSLIHEGHLDATHQRGDDVVEHGSQRR